MRVVRADAGECDGKSRHACVKLRLRRKLQFVMFDQCLMVSAKGVMNL